MGNDVSILGLVPLGSHQIFPLVDKMPHSVADLRATLPKSERKNDIVSSRKLRSSAQQAPTSSFKWLSRRL
jgi:hypothetical protein